MSNILINIRNLNATGKREMSEAVVDLIDRLHYSSSPSSSEKMRFTELSPGDKQAVILHAKMDIAEQLVTEIHNNQIDQVLTISIKRSVLQRCQIF